MLSLVAGFLLPLVAPSLLGLIADLLGLVPDEC